MSKSKESSACSSVVNYLRKTNRPYSANDIFNNLHKEYGKTAITKACDDLVANGTVKEKINGKQKIYFMDQSQFPETDETQLKTMDAKLGDLNNYFKCLTDMIKEKDSKLNTLNNSLTLEQIDTEIVKVKNEITQLKEKLQSIDASVKDMDPKENEKVKDERVKYVREWKKRKRMASSIIDAILDGYPKTKKILLEEIGVETDEDYKVSVPEI